MNVGARTRIKICCMGSVAEMELAVAAGADAVGLVAQMPSGAGIIADDRAAEIARATPPPVASILLTSRTDADNIAAHQRFVLATAVQLVWHIEPAEYPRLRALLPGVKLIQVVHVEDAGAGAIARDYAMLADALLLDSGRPSAAIAELGGTGRTHDWSVSRQIVDAVAVPVFLAGGLNPGNVAAAIVAVRPYGVDVCSGLRGGDGSLDADALSRFVLAVRGADSR
jgi:phosphoribosylanthranilate isomerase